MSLRSARGRTSVLAGFAAFGAFWGAWGATLPAIQQGAEASDAQLGFALLLIGAGALASMRLVGALIDRCGSGTTAWTVAGLGVCGVLPGLAGSPAQLAAATLALGAASGAMDVAINAEAVREEEASGRPVLNLAHAAFSGGPRRTPRRRRTRRSRPGGSAARRRGRICPGREPAVHGGIIRRCPTASTA
jgi:predicted MFS family arabinose efflux permease